MGKWSTSKVVWVVLTFLTWPLVAGLIEAALVHALDLVPATPLPGSGPDGPLYSDVASNALWLALIVMLLIVSFMLVYLGARVFRAPRAIWVAAAASSALCSRSSRLVPLR